MNDPLHLALAFAAGWAACLTLQLLWSAVMDFAADRFAAAEPLAKHERHPCPWPVDDEAERWAGLAEFQVLHNRGVNR